MLHRLDVALLRLLRTRGHQRPLERTAMRFTRLGEHGVLWYAVAAAGALLHTQRRPLYLHLARAVFAAQVFNTLTKVAIGRRRPLLDDLPALTPTVTTLSYPSAHATTSAVAATLLAGALPAAPVYVCAGAMALSRPYLGVHYPSDTIGGVLLGGAVARLVP